MSVVVVCCDKKGCFRSLVVRPLGGATIAVVCLDGCRVDRLPGTRLTSSSRAMVHKNSDTERSSTVFVRSLPYDARGIAAAGHHSSSCVVDWLVSGSRRPKINASNQF